MSGQHPLASLTRLFGAHTALTERERDIVLALPHSVHALAPSAYLVRDGEVPGPCPVLISGFAFRQKLGRDGTRQIVSIHIPGEVLDLQQIFLDRSDHNVQALTAVTVALVPRKALRDLMRTESAIATAVAVRLQIDSSIYREWILNIGRRNALQRVAHLLCELGARLTDAGLSDADMFELPFSQEQIADILGLTAVHVNRTLKALELKGLIARDKRRLRISSVRELRRAADFDDAYLHFGQQQGAQRHDEGRPVSHSGRG